MSETVTVAEGRAAIDDAELVALRSAMNGAALTPSDDGYEAARRVWNGNVDRRPALIARCAGVADVRRGAGQARGHGFLLSIRGGGHSAPGYGVNDGGVVIDLGLMKTIDVDPLKRTARAGGGGGWGAVG